MMTVKEQEDKVFEEITKVKSEMETIVGFKVTNLFASSFLEKLSGKT